MVLPSPIHSVGVISEISGLHLPLSAAVITPTPGSLARRGSFQYNALSVICHPRSWSEKRLFGSERRSQNSTKLVLGFSRFHEQELTRYLVLYSRPCSAHCQRVPVPSLHAHLRAQLHWHPNNFFISVRKATLLSSTSSAVLAGAYAQYPAPSKLPPLNRSTSKMASFLPFTAPNRSKK